MRIKFPNLRSFGLRWLVLIAPFVLLAPVWLTGKVFFWGTPPTQFIPWWWQAWKTLLSGEIPLWNPMLGMGAPLLANYQLALFYPFTWIYFVLAAIGGLPLMAWGLSILVAIHLAIAGWGMLTLLERMKLGEFAQTTGALAFSLSAFLVGHAQFLSINAAIPWLPWILVAAYELAVSTKPRASVKLAVFLAIQWLTGHAQVSWLSLLLVFAWFVFWVVKTQGWRNLGKKAIAFTAAPLLAFGLSAIQLLPTAEYLLESQRTFGVDRAAVMFSSFWPWRLIGLFAPNFFGNPAWENFSGYGNYWEDAIYIGLIPIGLALVSLWRMREDKTHRRLFQFLAVLILASFLLALGDNAPFFPWLYDNVPPFAMFKAPTRFSLWGLFALASLAAFAAERWKPMVSRKLYWQRISVAAAVSLLIGVALAYWLNAVGILHITPTYITALASAGVVALAAVTLNLLAALGRVKPKEFNFLVCTLLAVDLLFAGWGLNPAGSIELYKEDTARHDQLRADLNGSRLYMSAQEEQDLKYGYFFRPATFFSEDPLALRATLLPNINILDQIPSVNNYDPILPARYGDWIFNLEKAAPDLRAQLLAVMNVGAIEHLLPGDSASVDFERVVPAPRATWVNCADVVPTADQARSLVFSGEIDFTSETVVEGPDPDTRICGSGEVGFVELFPSTANKIQIGVDAPGGGWLVLSDTWFPGWRAFANGQELPIYPALGIFRAVELIPGSYQIDFVYKPASFSIGLTLSVFSWLAIAILWSRWRKQ